ncbi:MAG: DMT family transporter [Chloroflexota bacterium]
MGEIAGLVAAFIWAANNIMVRSQSDRLDMLSLNAIRCIAAAPIAVLAPVLLGCGDALLRTPPVALAYVLAAAVMAIGVGDTIYYVSQKRLGVSRAQPISNVYPIFTLMLAATFLGEKATWTLLAAVLLVVVGIYFLSARHGSEGEAVATAITEKARLGLGMAVGAGLCWAVATVLLRQGMVEMDALSAQQVRLPAIALLLVGMVRLTGRPVGFRRYGWRALLVVGGSGVLGMCIGGLLFLYSVQATGAAKASLLSSLSPFFGAPLAAILLGERITWRVVAGMLCCMGGVWLIFVPVAI